ATNRLASGASRVIALMVASGFPGCRAVEIALLRRSTAPRRAADASVIVRDTSVAVSIARSAIPGCASSGVSVFTFCNSLSSVVEWLVALDPRQCMGGKFVPQARGLLMERVGNLRCRRDLILSEETNSRH